MTEKFIFQFSISIVSRGVDHWLSSKIFVGAGGWALKRVDKESLCTFNDDVYYMNSTPKFFPGKFSFNPNGNSRGKMSECNGMLPR